ncbi:hypothetical protein ACFU6I_20280 [Streptomyces sp. NPDC057486]|uniref:hypothetical protein n=1 Tax=Streptomyces sp. NPDC057486 TaxID=3346145 RepID=UPI003692D700
MRTLTLCGGARVAVIAAQWCDAFGVVTCGRVQLELRDGEPGPVLVPLIEVEARATAARRIREAKGGTSTPSPSPARPSTAAGRRCRAGLGWRPGRRTTLQRQ